MPPWSPKMKYLSEEHNFILIADDKKKVANYCFAALETSAQMSCETLEVVGTPILPLEI
jgi:hypothetical protein